MSKIEGQKQLIKSKRRKRIVRAFRISDFVRYFWISISCTGLLISVGLYLMYLKTGMLNSEIEFIVFMTLGMMVASSYRGTLPNYFGRLSWYAKVIPAVILLYGLWHLFMGFGDLRTMPPDTRAAAKYHQMIFLHSLIISGHTFYCFLWSYILREQSPKKKGA